jgi:hypothetical protein
LALLVERFSDAEWQPTADERAALFSALFETADLAVIHSAFSNREDVVGLRDRLREIVRGPEQIALERAANAGTHARNVAFELVVGARLGTAGFPPRFDGRSDVLVEHEGDVVTIECKRPRSVDAVPDSIDEALTQCLGEVERRGSAQVVSALIALELSQVVNPGNGLLDTESAVEEALEDVANGMAASVDNVIRERWPPELLGVMSRFSGLVRDRRRDIPVYVQQWAFLASRGTAPQRMPLAALMAERFNAGSVLQNVIIDSAERDQK